MIFVSHLSYLFSHLLPFSLNSLKSSVLLSIFFILSSLPFSYRVKCWKLNGFLLFPCFLITLFWLLVRKWVDSTRR
ncbi:hypothetical protein RchiOBHm_Chr2g0104941 [Rosa chinensis]|uniref:Uncharacterized protein n=1 Tax=Rosa chinensis TaxID=74649 RepID=A0A2P6RNB1_ROSCH|nr:hypothetical protein RchiOBHm_Chr2g0104941 [Rosa chinensis]